MGLPDPLLHSLRGGSLYVEQLDLVSLACVSSRLLGHKQLSPSLWQPLARRAAALAMGGPDTSLAFVYKALAAADIRDSPSVCTLQGALIARMGRLELHDATNVIEALTNPFFATNRQAYLGFRV